MTIINYCDTLKTNKPLTKSYKDLDIILRNVYKPKRKSSGGKGLSLYEMIHLKDKDIKMYFDFDKYLGEDDDEEEVEELYETSLSQFIQNLFGIDSNEITINSDNRMTNKGYKLSYHFLLNYKINNNDLLKLLPKLKLAFKKGNFEIDSSVYGNGFQKFRIVMSKKHNKDGTVDKNSLLRMITDKNDLSRHLIQYIEGLEYLDLDKLNEGFTNLFDETEIKVIEYNNTESIEDIINSFELKSEKKFNDCVMYNVKCLCPFANREHTNNHCYLIRFTESLIMKCFSEECKGKVKVLYKNVNTDTIEFDNEVFNSFELEGESNYDEKKKYFEKYYKYFKDNNTLYRIKNIYNKKYDYYERDICVVDKFGLSDLFYQKMEKNKKGKMEKKNYSFIKSYMFDPKKCFLFNLVFNPDDKDMKKYYNLFDSFNYENVLNVNEEITDEDRVEFKFFLDYIKENICEGNQDWFNYFVGHFALIIQQPTFLNHIIFLFYSSKQRTGKSNFTKFLARVFGMKYCYFGSFNQIFVNPHSTAHLGTFLNIIEEINFNKCKALENELKDYSQREIGVYNPKGKTEIKVNTYVRYIGTSNNSNALPITEEDERFVVFEFKKNDDKNYVNRLEKFYNSKKMIYMFGDYLRNFKIPYQKRNGWIKNRPRTKAYEQMIYNDSIKQFLKDMVNCEDIFENELDIRNHIHFNMKENEIRLNYNIFYDYYSKYCLDNNEKGIFKKSNFFKQLLLRYRCIKKCKISGKVHYKFDLQLLKIELKIEGDFENKYDNNYMIESEEE